MKSMIVFPLVFATTLAVAQSGGMKGMDMSGMEMKSNSKTHHTVGVVKSVDAKKGTVTKVDVEFVEQGKDYVITKVKLG